MHNAAPVPDVLHDQSQSQEIEAAARTADALRDPLTGLPGIVLLCDRIRHALHRRKRSNSVFALISLSLDDYDKVVEELGSESSDELIVFLAHHLELRLRPNDSISWSGRGEFLILLDDVRSGADLGQICGRVSDTFQAPLTIERREIPISVRLGMALLTEQCAGPAEVVANARSARVHAQRNGVNGPAAADRLPSGTARDER